MVLNLCPASLSTRHSKRPLIAACLYAVTFCFSNLHFPYAKTLYTLYEGKVSSLAETEVREACGLLKPLKLDELAEDGSKDQTLAMGTTLFELYLCLQRFAV